MPIAPPESPAVATPFRPASGQTVVVVKNAAGTTVYLYDDDAAKHIFTGALSATGTISTSGNVSANAGAITAAEFPQLSPVGVITSGALPTQQFVSGAAAQVNPGQDVEVHTPVTMNSLIATSATCTVALSPDNVTFSTLCVWTEPVGVAFAGSIIDVVVRVPAGWYLKLTTVQAVLGLSTYY